MKDAERFHVRLENKLAETLVLISSVMVTVKAPIHACGTMLGKN